MKKTIVSFIVLAVGLCTWVSCSKDSPSPDQTVKAEISLFKITTPIAAAGTIDGTNITLDIPADKDLTNVTVDITLPDKVTVSPATGSVIDLTHPVVFTVTGKDKAGKDVTVQYTVSANLIPIIAFIGRGATINDLEDDAKAAASWMQAHYTTLFTYLPAANVTVDAMSTLKVAFIYELNPTDCASAADPDACKIAPVDLGAIGDKATIIGNWVRDGGNLLLAGDAAEMIFKIGRVPVAEANWNEMCCSGVETTHAIDGSDDWGYSVVTTTTSSDETAHPVFNGILDINQRLPLMQLVTREVRLYWWNVGPAGGGGCCGDVTMITAFEKKYKATKLASLRGVTDYFGFAMVEFGRTDLNTDATFSANVTKDFKGTVLLFNNTISGFEWAPNDIAETNPFQDNITNLTKNSIDYLKGL